MLDAGCGTGALAVELAARGAEVTAVDISPALIDIARRRCPPHLCDRIRFVAGDMFDPGLGRFDRAVAMDSMIYYDAPAIAARLGEAGPRLGDGLVFTLAPRTALLMAMWRIGRLFPRADRSPAMVPHATVRIAAALQSGTLAEIERVTSGFYISTALEYRP